MSDVETSPPFWHFPHCPGPPDWRLDWQAIERSCEWVRALAGCPQDPVYHAEGDVLVHTRMVCEALAGMVRWQELAPVARNSVFATTLMHDIAKPRCTKEELGRITARGHAVHGARMTRELLWREHPEERSLGFLQWREAVVALVERHGVPLWAIEKPVPERPIVEASWAARLDQLAIVAEADVLGRRCADQQQLLDRVTLFRELAAELDCLDKPRAFASDHARFVYFSQPEAELSYEAYDDTELEVVLLSGLPGAGKDTWLARNVPQWPVVSLDALRRELRIPAEDDQGAVVQAAKEQARTLLRQKRSFAWNATNTTRMLRDQLVAMFHSYHARVKIVYLETSRNELLRRNRQREHGVPEAVISRLVERLDVPTAAESHHVEWHIT